MKFWDSSAIVPLLVSEATTETMQAVAGEDPLMLVWWATPVVLRVHALRAAGALQLAAALIAAEGNPGSLEVVTLDERLLDAARREGFVAHEHRPSD